MKKIIIQVFLIALVALFTYKIYDTVQTPIEFKKEVKKHYSEVVNNLKQIREAELAYKEVYGTFTGSWDTLITFIETDSLPLVRKIGSLTDEMIDAGWTEEMALKKGKIIRDTVRVSVRDSLFKSVPDISQLKIIPYDRDKHEFFLGATKITTGSGVDVDVFEARAHNNYIFSSLRDRYEQEIINLNEKRRIDGKYPGLKVGSLKEANNNSGNWE